MEGAGREGLAGSFLRVAVELWWGEALGAPGVWGVMEGACSVTRRRVGRRLDEAAIPRNSSSPDEAVR